MDLPTELGQGMSAMLSHAIFLKSNTVSKWKYTIFTAELFRHTSWIYLEPRAWCIHATRQTTIIHNTGRARAGLGSVKRGLHVCWLVWNRINAARVRSQGLMVHSEIKYSQKILWCKGTDLYSDWCNNMKLRQLAAFTASKYNSLNVEAIFFLVVRLDVFKQNRNEVYLIKMRTQISHITSSLYTDKIKKKKKRFACDDIIYIFKLLVKLLWSSQRNEAHLLHSHKIFSQDTEVDQGMSSVCFLFLLQPAPGDLFLVSSVLELVKSHQMHAHVSYLSLLICQYNRIINFHWKDIYA